MTIIMYITVIITIIYTAYMQILNTKENKDIMELIAFTNKRIDVLEARGDKERTKQLYEEAKREVENDTIHN